MKVLVTGATGIIGNKIVLDLLKQGYLVCATKRKTTQVDRMISNFAYYTEDPEFWFSKIEWKEIDFDDIWSLKEALDGVEVVFHCAAKVSFSPKDKDELRKTNYRGTQNLLYACEESMVKKFIHISSIAVLDGYNEEGLLDENSDFNPKIDHSDYAFTKQASEMEVWRASAEGLSVIILNPGVVLSSGNWEQSSGSFIKNCLRLGAVFSGGTSFVDVRDVAKISTQLLEKSVYGERFTLVSENRSYQDMSNKIRRYFYKKEVTVLPTFVLYIGYFMNILFGWLFPGLKILNKNTIKSLTHFDQVSSQKIINLLGYQFITVDESLAFHIKNYMKDHELR